MLPTYWRSPIKAKRINTQKEKDKNTEILILSPLYLLFFPKTNN